MKLSESSIRKVVREALSKILIAEANARLNEGGNIPDDISKKVRARVKGKIEMMDPRPKGRLAMDITVKDGVAADWKQNKSSDEKMTKELGSYAWRAAKRAIDASGLEDGTYTWTLVV